MNIMESKLLAQEIKQYLNLHLNNIVTDVILFGSRVKGTANKDSDYDILIILDAVYDQKMKKTINGLCYDFDLNYDIFLDTQIISQAELKNSIRGKHPVFKAAIKEGLHA
jgi:predicted nucleotidyltransferase